MASITSRRITAILLKNKLEDLFAGIAPLQILACDWQIDGLNADLPTEAEVAAALEAYSALAVPAINTRDAIRDMEGVDPGDLTPSPWALQTLNMGVIVAALAAPGTGMAACEGQQCPTGWELHQHLIDQGYPYGGSGDAPLLPDLTGRILWQND